jgi:hypothetical protein
MVSMARQSVIPQKKRGPPATGKGTPIMVRVQPADLVRLDVWIAQQDEQPSRPEAIRRLVELGLAHAQPARPRGQKAHAKASEMASNELDRQGDSSATDEERASRKRRLLEGPKPFRDIRGDRPKTKG